MPPKKQPKSIRNKSKRYSCDLCTNIDNNQMALCSECKSKYHFNCIGIQPIQNNEDWVCTTCFELLTIEASRTANRNQSKSSKQVRMDKDQTVIPESSSNDVRQQAETDAGSRVDNQGSQIEPTKSTSQHQVNPNMELDVIRTSFGKDHSKDVENGPQKSKVSTNKSKSLKSTASKRDLELAHLEAVRQLNQKQLDMEKEYLVNKFQILMDNRSETSSRKSTDRTSFTRDWVKKNGEVQTAKINEVVTTAQVHNSPPYIQDIDDDSQISDQNVQVQRELNMYDNSKPFRAVSMDHINPGVWRDDRRDFFKRVEYITLDGVEKETHQEKLQQIGASANKSAPPETIKEDLIRKSTSCSVHDARLRMFSNERHHFNPESIERNPTYDQRQFPATTNQDFWCDDPISKYNSNFTAPMEDQFIKTNWHISNDETEKGRSRRKNVHSTPTVFNGLNSTYIQDSNHRQESDKRSKTQENSGNAENRPNILFESNNIAPTESNIQRSTLDANLESQAQQFQSTAKVRIYPTSFIPTSSTNVRFLGNNQASSGIVNQRFDELTNVSMHQPYIPSNHTVTSKQQPLTSIPHSYGRSQPPILLGHQPPISLGHRPPIMSTGIPHHVYSSNIPINPTYGNNLVMNTNSNNGNYNNSDFANMLASDNENEAVRNLTKEQIAARHVVDKKLPIFTGDPSEWPIWYHQYKNSTKLCGFTKGENLDRLEKCLRGKARDAVKSRLIHPQSVPWIIETLAMLYGRPEVIIKTTINKIRDYPSIKSDRLDALMDFAFEVQSICTTIESLNCPNHLTDPMLIDDLVEKLPTQEKKDWARFKAGNWNVTLKTLADWLYDLAKVLSTVTTPRVTKSNNRNSEEVERNEKAIGLEHVNVHVNQTNGENGSWQGNQQRKNFPCPVCNNECIKVENCSKFKSLAVNARWKAMNEHKLCRRCLRKHRSPCRATSICGKDGCQFKHHFLLHNDERHSSLNNKFTADATVAPANFHSITNGPTMLRIVPVILYNGIKSVATFAFLDDGTTVTMMEKRLADELGLNGTVEQLCLVWTKKIHRQERAERVSLKISGIEGFNKRYELKGVRTVNDLHLPVQTMNKNELVAKYPYLRDVPIVDYNNVTPGIMIGSDMPKFATQLQIIESEDVEDNEFNGPMASRTRLGWSVHGPKNDLPTKKYVNIHQFEICPHHNELDNEIHHKVKEYFSVENFGVQANDKFNLESKDNERALEMLNRLTKKKKERYETGLLWKGDNVILPDSYPMALKRLVGLERQGSEIIQILGGKIDEYVAKGYARKLTQKDLEYDGPVWYLPLFGVINPKKPEKVRMVFDAAAKVRSISLNSVLLKGPDFYTSLIDILRRFRERLYTGGGDIAEMYHQVSIIEKDRHFQRFLFRENNAKNPDVYEMDVMTFGANCSPCSAQFVKNKNAAEFKITHPRAVSAIIENHYVDDMMDCEHTEKDMIKLMEDVRMIHASGGFKIRNFISNSENVLKALGEIEASDVKDIALKTELKVERVLGMWYNTKSDVFTFSLKYTSIEQEIFNGTKLPTKREILRTLMSIFDPLGLLSNFLIYLKILLQEVWRTQMDWDEQLSSRNLIERWERWLKILPEVEKVKVPRLYSPKMSPNTPNSIQMHIFVDASEDAFAAVIYLRVEDNDGVDVAFVGSKTRVAPLKYLSIPRKELQASVLGTRFSASVKNAQRFKIDRRIIWTDSATVISWLNSDHRKYSQFVAHRVGEILENSDVNEWRWIPTKENVADEATKWTKAPNFEFSNRWFRGPDFLRASEDLWPEKKPIQTDVEVEMKANFVHSSFLIPQIIDPERFSNYKRMVRSLAYAMRFRNSFTNKAENGKPLNQDELRRAESLIFRQAQFEGYPSEMVTLTRNKVLPIDKQKFIEKPSPLYGGTPYLDAEGVLRMKGRIDGARELSMDTKRPIVLPKDSRITKLLMLEYHSNFFHQNHETVVNEVRQKFYIPNLRVVLKKTRKDCQNCKIKKAHPIPPQMADLPAARLAARFIPFSFVGIDFFGPMYVTVGRHTEKRWGVLFTCLTIRAIHIEIAPGLDTNSCIICIQNFIADHGPVIEFHSDCGTNFKGSDNVLQQEIGKIEPDRLQTEFTTTYTKWIFNPPASPHMGGSWERLIRLVKSGIEEIMPTRTPKEDMLRNLLKQIQNVINSRPLTFIPLDVEEDEALTPNHFLKLSSNGSKPPCKIDLDGPYLRESWKESQRLTEVFWKRFVMEYLPTIARRTKWHKIVAPLKQGDLVLIVDENSPRNTYPKARILRTQIGSNGQVRRAKVEVISGTKTDSKGQICKVKKIELWRSAHKLALLDVASKDGLAQPSLDRETGGSVRTTGNTDPNTDLGQRINLNESKTSKVTSEKMAEKALAQNH